MNKLLASLRRAARDDRGAAAVEFALIAVPLFAVTFAIMEFGLAWWRWAAAQKAAQLAVRQAVQTQPVAADFTTFDALAAGYRPGDRLTLDVMPSFAVVCDESGCGCAPDDDCGHFAADPAFDVAAFDRIFAAAQRVMPQLERSNLVVEYAHVGIGFAGRPGPDSVPAVTVRLRGMKYNVMALHAFGLPSEIDLPEFATTLSGEDLQRL